MSDSATPTAEVITQQPEASPTETTNAQPSQNGNGQQPEKSKGRGWQRRIDRQSRKIAQLEERLAKYEPPDPGQQQQTEIQQAGTEIKPAAEVEKKARELIEQRDREAAEQRDREHLVQVWTGHQQRIANASKKYPDWKEINESFRTEAPISPAVGFTLMELDNGADVIYYLAKHPEALKALRGMSDGRAIAELGRISGALSGSRATEKPQSSAPEPITPLRSTASKPTLDSSKLPLSEYIKQRNAGQIK